MSGLHDERLGRAPRQRRLVQVGIEVGELGRREVVVVVGELRFGLWVTHHRRHTRRHAGQRSGYATAVRTIDSGFVHCSSGSVSSNARRRGPMSSRAASPALLASASTSASAAPKNATEQATHVGLHPRRERGIDAVGQGRRQLGQHLLVGSLAHRRHPSVRGSCARRTRSGPRIRLGLPPPSLARADRPAGWSSCSPAVTIADTTAGYRVLETSQPPGLLPATRGRGLRLPRTHAQHHVLRVEGFGVVLLAPSRRPRVARRGLDLPRSDRSVRGRSRTIWPSIRSGSTPVMSTTSRCSRTTAASTGAGSRRRSWGRSRAAPAPHTGEPGRARITRCASGRSPSSKA